MRPPADDDTLAYARNWLRQAVRTGAHCPCCTQYAKVYRRKLNSGMARSLIRCYRHAGTDWINLPASIPARSREEGKLRYWGLMVPGEVRGWWRVTTKGEMFVLNRLRVPRWVLVYDDRLLGIDASQKVSIIDSLGDRFDYEELMNA